jgi:hypothetical protein
MRRKDSGYTRTMTKQSTAITNALRSIYDALAPLTAKDRHRVVSATMVLLEGESPKGEAKPVVIPIKVDTHVEARPVVQPKVNGAKVLPRAKPSAQAVRDYFNGSRGSVVTRAELIAFFGKDHENTVDQEVSRLIHAGAVMRQGTGRYEMPLPHIKGDRAAH